MHGNDVYRTYDLGGNQIKTTEFRNLPILMRELGEQNFFQLHYKKDEF